MLNLCEARPHFIARDVRTTGQTSRVTVAVKHREPFDNLESVLDPRSQIPPDDRFELWSGSRHNWFKGFQGSDVQMSSFSVLLVLAMFNDTICIYIHYSGDFATLKAVCIVFQAHFAEFAAIL